MRGVKNIFIFWIHQNFAGLSLLNYSYLVVYFTNSFIHFFLNYGAEKMLANVGLRGQVRRFHRFDANSYN